MTDILTPQQRSTLMSKIRSKNTKPEILVRKYLFSRGLRFRINVRTLPGTPDIVLPKYRVIIFINGCFWHGHKDCKYYRLPKTNTKFWQHKIALNATRDYVNDVNLQLDGWKVLRIWECQLKTKARREVTLTSLFKSIVDPMSHADHQKTSPSVAAEPYTPYGS